MNDIILYIALGLFFLFCAGMVWEYTSTRDEHAKFQRWFDQGWGWRITGKRDPARIGSEWTTGRVALLAGVVLVLIFVVRLAIDLV